MCGDALKMRKGVGLGLLFAALCGAAFAAGYDDFTRGMALLRAGNAEGAIAAFTVALNAGDLAPTYVPAAHLKRAEVYLATGKCKEALADADEALKGKSADPNIYVLRAVADGCLGDRDAAKKDLAAALALRPTAAAYETYAHYQWEDGQFTEAGKNFAAAANLFPHKQTHRLYLLLWQWISASRAGTLDAAAFEAAVKATNADGWPGPILDFYRGKTSEEKVYREASTGDAVAVTGQKCEADFYLAEWHIVKGDAAAAKPLMQRAAESCPKTFIETGMVKTELARLK
jgi:tetratricopeptide (TPR) repeat protein